MNTVRVLLPALALSLFGGALAAQSYPSKPAPTKPATTPSATTPSATTPSATTPATTPVMPPAAVARTPARGSELVGRRVVDANDKVLGSIGDLVIPDAGGLIALVKRDAGGLVCVPMSAMQPKLKSQDSATTQSMATAQVDAFVFAQDRDKLLSAETVSGPEAVDAAAVEACRARFIGVPGVTKGADSGMPGSEPAKGGGEASASPPASNPPAAGTPPKSDPAAAARTPDASKPLCLKKLLGANVKDTKGQNVGEVKDLAVDLGKADVAYVVVSTGGALGVGAKLEGVPLNSFKRSDDGQSLVISMSAETLKSGIGVDLDRLPMMPSVPGSSSGTR